MLSPVRSARVVNLHDVNYIFKHRTSVYKTYIFDIVQDKRANEFGNEVFVLDYVIIRIILEKSAGIFIVCINRTRCRDVHLRTTCKVLDPGSGVARRKRTTRNRSRNGRRVIRLCNANARALRVRTRMQVALKVNTKLPSGELVNPVLRRSLVLYRYRYTFGNRGQCQMNRSEKKN